MKSLPQVKEPTVKQINLHLNIETQSPKNKTYYASYLDTDLQEYESPQPYKAPFRKFNAVQMEQIAVRKLKQKFRDKRKKLIISEDFEMKK